MFTLFPSGGRDVLLLNMPFGPLHTPSLALSLIKPIIQQSGISADIFYANISFAKLIDENIYHYIASGIPNAHDLIGEFIFSKAMFSHDARTEHEFIEYLFDDVNRGRKKYRSDIVDYLLSDLRHNIARYRETASLFISCLAKEIEGRDYKLIGLTNAFQQQCASLAIARLLKERHPGIKIVLGGANCEDPMGFTLFQQNKFIDAVVSGEAERVVSPLFSYLLGIAESLPPFRGLWVRTCSDDAPIPLDSLRLNPMVTSFADIPPPDFQDFASQIATIRCPESPRLLYETSRGCWWGEKHHCKFCGLNGSTMAFRSKTAEQAVNELRDINLKYPDFSISMTDNIIDYRYFSSFLPELIKLNISVDLFYEMKANIKKDHLIMMKRAGINRIQPGIESLSSPILKLMDKGISALQNIQLLRWCKEIGIDPEWNLLWGFPGEPEEEYERTAQIIDRIIHLKPPGGVGKLRLDRFSPYFKGANRYFKDHFYFPAYNYVYPYSSAVLKDLAYFFDFTYCGDQDPERYTAHAKDKIAEWKRSYESCHLFYFDRDEDLIVIDTRKSRSSQESEIFYLNESMRRILIGGENVQNISAILEKEKKLYGIRHDSNFEYLLNLGLILVEGQNYICLPVRSNENYPSRELLQVIFNIHPEKN